MVLRTAPPGSTRAVVGKRIRWSGKRPKIITAKYATPMTSNLQAAGAIPSLTIVYPRNTRSTRKEVAQEGDGYAVALRLKFFGSFRVFRGPILSFPRYACRLGEESQDSRLVFLSRCAMQIDVPSIRH